MIKTLFPIVLLSAAAFSSGCKSAAAENEFDAAENGKTSIEAQPAVTPKTNESAAQTKQSPTSGRTASFKGVSFSYNPQIFGEAVPEEVAEQTLENETDKPDDIYPRHVRFNFKKPNRERFYTIAVFPIEDYRRIWKAAEKNNQAIFDEELRAVQKAVKDKNFRKNGEMPSLPYMDASAVFVARAKNLRFQNGDGVFYLTQFTQDYAALVNNDELTCIYQGITADGKYYVLAEFPASVSFLPNRDATEFENYKMPQNYQDFQKGERQYRRYLSKITRRLENLPPGEYKPSLRYFEEIISTLKIKDK